MEMNCCSPYLCKVNYYLSLLPTISFSLNYAVAILICVLVIYYRHYKCAKLTLYYSETKINNYIALNSKSFQNIYTPTPYLANGVLQTLFYKFSEIFLSKSSNIKYEREFVHLQDGGQISLDWVKNPFEEIPKIIVAILPGICGGKDESYAQEAIRQCIQNKFGVVVINQRGLSHTPLLTPKLFSASNNDDTSEALLAIKVKCPNQAVYAIGFSLGANIIANVFFIRFITFL